MMDAPNYLLPRPQFEITSEMANAFNQLFSSTPNGEFIHYSLPYPKWQFLSYLCETNDLVLHGSQTQDINHVEPRKAIDKKAYSNQHAIYATTDGIWVLYFAIIDRKKYPEVTLFNSCLQARINTPQWSDPLYFFSITQSVLIKQPWCNGVVYILPRQLFKQEPVQQIQGTEIMFPHWICDQSIEPVAKIMVSPQDFPFLDQIHGHNNEKLIELFETDPGGFPWPDALEF
jgi:hypothetical protein